MLLLTMRNRVDNNDTYDVLLVKKMTRIAICNNNSASAAVSVTSVLPKKVSMTCTPKCHVDKGAMVL